MARTYLYKLTSDRGGAPCAIPPADGEDALLTLAICKPAIRRTAQPGDRVIGLSSRALAASDGYPLCAVIYAAVVAQNLRAEDYYGPAKAFSRRPDCIYEFHQQNGRADHSAATLLHRSEDHMRRDLGTYPLYRNGHVLLCRDFRYFGAEARIIPAASPLLRHIAESMGQSHRVFTDADPEAREADRLLRQLWKLRTRYTPVQVGLEAYEPGGRHPRKATSSLQG